MLTSRTAWVKGKRTGFIESWVTEAVMEGAVTDFKLQSMTL